MAASAQRKAIGMNPAYRKINRSRARFLVYWGSAGSGKSVNIALKLVTELSFGPPGVHCLVVRKTKESHTDSTRAELVSAMRAIFGNGWMNEWDAPASRLTLTNKKNGNSFIFRGVKDEAQREQLKSISVPQGKIEKAWVEEATEILPSDFNQINARMRGALPEGHYYQTVLSFNPVSATHWLKRRFFDRVDPSAETCHTTWRDNRFIDDEYRRYMESMEEIDPEFAQVYGRGEWGTRGGLILTRHQVRPCAQDLDAYDAVSMGHDFGFNHADALLLLGWKDGAVHVIREHYAHGMTNAEVIKAVEADPLFMEAKRRRVWMVCDSAEPDRIREWQRAGWRARPVDKGKNRATASAIDWLKARWVYIDGSAENTAAEAGEWAYMKDRATGQFTDEPVPVNDDAMAALRYGTEPWRLNGGKKRRKLEV
jgi:phage terminase large subunit